MVDSANNDGISLSKISLQNEFSTLDAFCPARIEALEEPHIVHINQKVQKLLGLKRTTDTEQKYYVDYFGGKQSWSQAQAVASAYAGHQFGIYVAQLGDGRAVLLGRVRASDGQYYELGLKGSGPTHFSRGGDGRAVLRSTIREYLCGEAMHALGINSTRALTIIGSSTPVQRENTESAAILVRVARTHIRFGHFEYFHYRNEHKTLKRLADMVIEQHHPDIAKSKTRYSEWFRRTVIATAKMIAGWQVVGFAHGVMNTDNMSILGDTLDYGPYGFMETYDPQWICNHSDARGRYAWHRQPSIGLWNLAALGQAISTLVDEKTLKKCLAEYEATLTEHWLERMRAKLGLSEKGEGDFQIITDWLDMLRVQECDYHRSFRALQTLVSGEDKLRGTECPHEDERFIAWNKRYQTRLKQESQQHKVLELMQKNNPIYVLRNYLAHQAIVQATEKHDYGEIDYLLKLIQSPCEEIADSDAYTQSAPEWAQHLELSCSS